MELTHEEIQELLGAYALDAVDGDERGVVEAHLAVCPRCRAEVQDHREVAALLAYTGAPAPAGVWDRIVGSLEGDGEVPAMRLEVVRPQSAGHPPATTTDAPWSGASLATGSAPVTPLRADGLRKWAPALLAAAAVLVVLGILAGRTLGTDDGAEQVAQRPTLEQVAAEAKRNPEAKQIALTTPDGSKAAPLVLTPDGAGFLDATSMPVLAADETYQLWGRTHNETISLGTFSGGAKAVPFQISSDVELFAVTVEEAGGVISSEQEPLMVGEVS